MVLLGQRVAGLGRAELGHRADVARRALRDRPLLLAERRGQRTDPLVVVVVLVPAGGAPVAGHVHGGVGAQRAGEDADQADPADVGVGGGLDHLGQQRPLGVGGQPADRLAVRGGHRGQRVLGGGGEGLGHHFEQLEHADPLRRGHDEHRVEAAARDGLLQILDEHLGVDLFPGQVPVHQGLVFALGDDALDQLPAQLLHPVLVRGRRRALGPGSGAPARVAVQLLRQQPDQPVHRGPDRQVQGRDRVAEGFTAGVQGGVELGPLMVDLGDDHGARHAHRGALLPQHPGQAVDPLGGGDGEQRRVRGPEPGPEVPREVGVAGRVEQIDLDAVVHEGREGQVDRALLPDLDLVEVTDRGALFDAALPLDGPRRGEQRLDQAGLPRPGMADQYHVPYLVGRRCPASGSSRPTACCCQLPSPPCD